MADEYNRDRSDEGGDDEEEEVDETSYKAVKDAVLFAIEVSNSMLTPPPASDSKKVDRESPTTAALKCAYALMQQRIISNPKDMIGILLYGTEASRFHGEEDNIRGGLSYPHCYLLTDLDIPAAEDVKALKKLVEDEDESTKLLKTSDEPVSMANVLFCANQIFTTKAANFSSRRLFIVTDNDNPHAQDKALRASAGVRAKDLYDLGVIIELFPISKPDHEFDPSKFYDDIIYRTSPTDPEAPAYLSTKTTSTTSGGDGLSLLASLLSSINSKAIARRALFASIPLEIAPSLKISVKGYILFKRQEAARSCYIYLGSEKPQIVKGSTTQMADDTARSVEKWEVRKAYKFGGEQVTFSPEEIKTLRNFGDPVIRIIGFKPLSMLPIWASLKHSTFIYPSEEDFVGSTRVFSALWQKLLRDNKMAVAWFIARRNAAPAIAALIPGAERLDANGVQTMSPGLWIVPLPFADDMRQNPETTLLRAEDSLTDRMRDVIQQLQLPGGRFEPSKYPNPALQWHYRILQALALDEDVPVTPEDKTIPKYKQIDKRAGEYVVAWGLELEAQYRAHQAMNRSNSTSTLAKRPASSSADGASKRPKKETNGDSGLGDEEIRMYWQKATLSKLTVVQLKEFLVKKGLAVAGKKPDLIERVEGYFEKK